MRQSLDLARPGLTKQPSGGLFAIGRALGVALDTLFDWMDRYRQRCALHSLPDYLLKDMGLSRVDVERETGKPFWKP